jgi:hypothetical protein
MKKSIGVLIAVMFLVSLMPAVSSIDGSINYNPDGGGNTIPVKILAIWETNGDDYTLDDDYYSPGCQIDPPLEYNAYSEVWVYVAVLDLNDPMEITDTDQIKIDISWPENDIPDRDDLGIGGKAWDNLEPVYFASWAEYEMAHSIDYGSNWPFICYYNQANDEEYPDGYEYIHWQYFENNVIFFKAKYELYYHDPAGWYDADVTIQASTYDNQKNYFEYVYTLAISPDFEYVGWGGQHLINTWHAKDGNWVWSYLDGYPTIRNVGNWDTELGCHFTAGDFATEDVLFDIRAGDANPESEKYNPTYCEENSLDGMIPCNWDYYPIPIDNDPWLGYDTEYDDVLLKCHLMKLDFYIKVLQWTNGPGPYSFDIDLFCMEPQWYPAPGFPCPLGPPDQPD